MLDPEQILNEGDCTLVVANHGSACKYTRRGVIDLLKLLESEPDYLYGAAVADKIVGKAAASLMITGKIDNLYTRVITPDARDLLAKAGISTRYETLTEYVQNRSATGRCPLDTLCADITDVAAMVSAIKNFYANIQQ